MLPSSKKYHAEDVGGLINPWFTASSWHHNNDVIHISIVVYNLVNKQHSELKHNKCGGMTEFASIFYENNLVWRHCQIDYCFQITKNTK